MSKLTKSAGVVALVISGVARVHGQAASWPIQPVDKDHPLGATLGEFRDSGVVDAYQHAGIDILATPCINPCSQGDASCTNPCKQTCGDPTAAATVPCVFVSVAGVPSKCWENKAGLSNHTLIVATDSTWPKPRTYEYWHLEYGSFDAGYMDKCTRMVTVEARAPIARVIKWTSPLVPTCPYHHLHYGIYEGTGTTAVYLNPLKDLAAGIAPDTEDPQIKVDGVHLAKRTSTGWNVFNPTLGACTVVHGQVDIVVHLLDLDTAGVTDPGASNVGVHSLRWRACTAGNASCPWGNAYEFDRMPAAWAVSAANTHTTAQFSTALPWKSNFDECSNTDETFMVATSEPSASWNTTVGTPDGSYTVSVKASDYAGNATTQSLLACVQNGTGCTTDLNIRDGASDNGATPYLDTPFWASPDITVNPGTADENRNIKVGAPNVVVVGVRNTGSCTLPVGTTYNVCLGWSPPSDAVPHPMPASQTITCQMQTVTATGWVPGTSRPTTLTWNPVVGSVPFGDHNLVAWSDMPADPVRSTPSVILDNNRGQRNIAFIEVPVPNPPGEVIVQ